MSEGIEYVYLDPESLQPVESGQLYRKIITNSGTEVYEAIAETMIKTIRIDAETVADITYLFDLEAGDYIEQSPRVERAEPLPPSPEDRIAQLEDENSTLALELVETQVRLDQAEDEQAALLLELVNKGVI